MKKQRNYEMFKVSVFLVILAISAITLWHLNEMKTDIDILNEVLITEIKTLKNDTESFVDSLQEYDVN